MTKKSDTPPTKSIHTSWLKYPLFAIFIIIIGAVAYYTHLKPSLSIGKGTPLTHTPTSNIKILNEPDTLPHEIIDITTDVQKRTPFPERIIEKNSPSVTQPSAKEITRKESSPAENSTPAPLNLETAQLLQATLELAKKHSQQQELSAKFHTLMGLILNPTLSPSEQSEWAKLALPFAQKMKAEAPIKALQILITPTPKNQEEMTLPTWLTPFENLVQVRRIDNAPDVTTHADRLKNLRAAYHTYLMNESH